MDVLRHLKVEAACFLGRSLGDGWSFVVGKEEKKNHKRRGQGPGIGYGLQESVTGIFSYKGDIPTSPSGY